MSEENYDTREACINLKKIFLSKDERKFSDKYSNQYKNKNVMYGNTIYYQCSLTNKRCVGASERTLSERLLSLSNNDKLNPEIIKRCPVRKTIDNLLKENNELSQKE